jgi:ABC-type Na+ efflux pump permease subunit
MGTETVAGKILIGVAVAVISGAIGALGGAIFTGNVPPEAEITPEAVTVRPDASVQFSAEASRDPEGGNLTYTWSVGGIPFDKTPWAQCSADGPRAECRFTRRG